MVTFDDLTANILPYRNTKVDASLVKALFICISAVTNPIHSLAETRRFDVKI